MILLTQFESIIPVDDIIVEFARRGGAINRCVVRPELRATLNAHNREIKSVLDVTGLHTIGQATKNMPHCICGERVHRICKSEWRGHFSQAQVQRQLIQVSEKDITPPQLQLIP